MVVKILISVMGKIYYFTVWNSNQIGYIIKTEDTNNNWDEYKSILIRSSYGLKKKIKNLLDKKLFHVVTYRSINKNATIIYRIKSDPQNIIRFGTLKEHYKTHTIIYDIKCGRMRFKPNKITILGSKEISPEDLII